VTAEDRFPILLIVQKPGCNMQHPPICPISRHSNFSLSGGKGRQPMRAQVAVFDVSSHPLGIDTTVQISAMHKNP